MKHAERRKKVQEEELDEPLEGGLMRTGTLATAPRGEIKKHQEKRQERRDKTMNEIRIQSPLRRALGEVADEPVRHVHLLHDVHFNVKIDEEGKVWARDQFERLALHSGGNIGKLTRSSATRFFKIIYERFAGLYETRASLESIRTVTYLEIQDTEEAMFSWEDFKQSFAAYIEQDGHLADVFDKTGEGSAEYFADLEERFKRFDA